MAKSRSPNYPAISLPDAIARVEKIYKNEGKNPMSREAIASILDYDGLTGTSIPVISAISKYGLIEGRGDDIHVSSDAVTILIDPEDSDERRSALGRVAVNPRIFKKLSQKFPKTPTVDTARIYLEKGDFTPKAARKAAKNYVDTMEFVISEGVEYDGGEDDDTPREFSVGDSVQWESQDVYQFGDPRTIRDIQERDGETWVFVDGSETGILSSEVVLIESSKEPQRDMNETPELPRKPPSLALPTEKADTYLLTIPFKGKPLSVRVQLPGEELRSEHFKKVKAHLDLLIDDSVEEAN